MKKLLSIMLSIIMIVTSVPFAFAADETPPTRKIDGKTYYELDSADDLYWFAEQVNVNENDTINAILTADIVINENLMSKITVAEDGTATINEGETVREWTPIKYYINSDTVGYKGIFDGSNHTISGLYGNSDDMYYMGFFALANGATIKNLGIIDSYFYEYRNVASVVAFARNTTIINCFSENCLIANESQRAGGIAGTLYNSNIIGCYNASTIRESGGGYYSGGIVGESVSTTISDCFNTGSIVATGDMVGGIVGCINSSSAVVENCYNIGKINSDSEKTGGIAGENWGSVIDCYFNSEIFSGSAIGINKGSVVSSEGKTALQFASGEVAYAFGSAWGQKLGTDPYPVLGSTDTVYRVATYTKCDMSDVPVCEYNNTSGSDINNAPQHILTGEIICMGELCEVCGKYYGDADESKHLLSWKTAKEATCAEPGLEIYDCEVCGNAPAMETVLCDSATYPESGHNYPSQANEEYAFSYPGATKLVITFSEDTETEKNYDFIYIYDSTGTEYGKYSGTELAGVQIDLEGGSFKIKLTSDVSGNRYGFRLASVYATAPTAEYQREIPALGHSWSNKDGICAKEDCGYECPHENFTDGKCDACGYDCPHEGQSGSCENCGVNLGKLVIDVTDKSFVEIGNGYDYYDEDGYIITGTNQNASVNIIEETALTLSNLTLGELYFNNEPDDSVINITLDGTTEVTEFVSLYRAHLIFDGGETDIFKVPYFTTAGNSGSVTVNSGNIILDCVTEYNLSAIACDGGFTINGGTVTASNNYFYVVSRDVTLNGGELNIISTAADRESISSDITMDKGTLMTVSATGGILYSKANILKADELTENDYFFVRYDTESEFVPVSDIRAALDGKTYAEIKIDTHEHSFENGKCVCGYECSHSSYTMGICDVCNYLCPHSFTEFNEILAPKCEETGLEESYCDYCKIRLEQEIPATDHKWIRDMLIRPTQNTDGSWTDGYYYDKCENDEAHNVVTGVAKRADYTAYDNACAKLSEYLSSVELTDTAVAEIQKSLAMTTMVPDNLVEGESSLAFMNNWVNSAETIIAKIENGEYVEINGLAVFSKEIAKWEHKFEENGVFEKAAEITNNLTEEAAAKLQEIYDFACSLNGSVTENAENIAKIEADVDEIFGQIENCVYDIHNGLVYEVIEEAECGKNAVEAATCTFCGAIVEREVSDSALTHTDADGDYICDHGCGHEFEKPVAPDEPADDTCDHLCHKDGILGFFWKIACFFFRLFNIQQYCDCGEIHYDAPIFG